MRAIKKPIPSYLRLLAACARGRATPQRVTRLVKELCAAPPAAQRPAVEAGLCLVQRLLPQQPAVAAHLLGELLCTLLKETLACAPELRVALLDTLRTPAGAPLLKRLRVSKQHTAALFVLLAAERALRDGSLPARTLSGLLQLCTVDCTAAEGLPAPAPDREETVQLVGRVAKAAFEGLYRQRPTAALERLAPVLEHLPGRGIFVDRLRAIFEGAVDPDQRLLALKCLTILVAAGPYEISAYYPMLYGLLQADEALSLFECAHASVLCKIVEASLCSNRLPSSVRSSFTKLLLRRALTATTRTGVFLGFLLFNLFKQHPELRQRSREGSEADDPFRLDAAITDNSAATAPFWELSLLQRHVVAPIAAAFQAIDAAEDLDFVDLASIAAPDVAGLLSARLPGPRIAGV